MAAKLVWLTAIPGLLSCGHTTANGNGRPGVVEGEWYCDLCALHITAALDQEIAAAQEAARARGEAWD
jgi:hypothetical protein